VLALFFSLSTDVVPPLSVMRVERHFEIPSQGDRWAFDSLVVRQPDYRDEYEENRRYMVVRKNGRVVRRLLLSYVVGNFIEAKSVPIRTGYPVIAVRSVFGLGEHWDTVFFAIRNHRLIDMGRPPAMNSNGPVLWHGNRALWLFDNYDRYEMRDGRKFMGIVDRVSASGRLTQVKRFALGETKVRRVYSFPEME
jgi:hypothetical protein